jgi:hypothetical protein
MKKSFPTRLTETTYRITIFPHLGVAQLGQRTCMGCKGSEVQILSPRLFSVENFVDVTSIKCQRVVNRVFF